MGTLLYQAPEIRGWIDEDLDDYNKSVDIWSLGCIGYTLLAGKPMTERELRSYSKGLKPLPLDLLQENGVSRSAIDFIKKLLVPQPDQRPSAHEALLNPWVAPLSSSRSPQISTFVSSDDHKALKWLYVEGFGCNGHDLNGPEALYWAVQSQLYFITDFLFRNGVHIDTMDPRDSGRTALHLAAEAGDLTATEFLLSKGADLFLQNPSGCSAIHYAAAQGSEDIVHLLLRWGGDINCAGPQGQSALHLAASAGDAWAASLLLRQGAWCESRCKNGNTPLHYASSNGYIAIVTLLLDHGAGVDVQCQKGRSALRYAVDHNHLDVAQMLLARGASVHKPDSLGISPLAQARTLSSVDIAPWLSDRSWVKEALSFLAGSAIPRDRAMTKTLVKASKKLRSSTSSIPEAPESPAKPNSLIQFRVILSRPITRFRTLGRVNISGGKHEGGTKHRPDGKGNEASTKQQQKRSSIQTPSDQHVAFSTSHDDVAIYQIDEVSDVENSNANSHRGSQGIPLALRTKRKSGRDDDTLLEYLEGRKRLTLRAEIERYLRTVSHRTYHFLAASKVPHSKGRSREAEVQTVAHPQPRPVQSSLIPHGTHGLTDPCLYHADQIHRYISGTDCVYCRKCKKKISCLGYDPTPRARFCPNCQVWSWNFPPHGNKKKLLSKQLSTPERENWLTTLSPRDLESRVYGTPSEAALRASRVVAQLLQKTRDSPRNLSSSDLSLLAGNDEGDEAYIEVGDDALEFSALRHGVLSGDLIYKALPTTKYIEHGRYECWVAEAPEGTTQRNCL